MTLESALSSSSTGIATKVRKVFGIDEFLCAIGGNETFVFNGANGTVRAALPGDYLSEGWNPVGRRSGYSTVPEIAAILKQFDGRPVVKTRRKISLKQIDDRR